MIKFYKFIGAFSWIHKKAALRKSLIKLCKCFQQHSLTTKKSLTKSDTITFVKITKKELQKKLDD